ncbi:MAG: porin [Spongiibacteraceae bacterium]
MKPQYLTAAMLFAASQYALSDIDVYGKASVSLQNTELESEGSEQWELNSNASRLGVKGKYQIAGTSITAIFKAEYEIAIDDGVADEKNSNTFKQRNVYLGLTGDWGTAKVGNFDTATKLLSKEVDLFNDLVLGDIKNILVAENRIKNTIEYTSPTYSGFTASVALVPGEDPSANEDGIDDGRTLSVQYRNDTVTFAIAGDDNIKGYDTVRAVANAKFGPLQLAALIQSAEESDGTAPAEEESVVISASFKAADKLKLKLQYGVSETESSSPDEEKTQLAIGADYKLAKNMKLFAYAAQVDTDITGAASTSDNTVGIGTELKF